MLQFTIDSTKCTKCGQCVRDCPAQIIERAGDNVPVIRSENEGDCLRCQHCLAVCPEAALSIFGRAPKDSLGLAAKSFPSLDKMLALVRGRRSVRRYRDENVDQTLIQKLLTAVTNAPTGVNRMAVTFSVIDDKDAMHRLRVRCLDSLAASMQAGTLPEQHEFLAWVVPAWIDKKEDVIFRGAPHMLIAAAGTGAACPQEDVNLALAYFELMAQCAGLGTVWCGLAKMALELVPDLKKDMGLAPGHCYYAMLFGVPAVHYRRTVQRDDPSRIRRVQIQP